MAGHSWAETLDTIHQGESLTREQAAWSMEQIMEGQATAVQLAAFLSGLRVKGETVEEIAGLVETMRAYSKKVVVEGPLVDTCGTGGDRAGTINVSTIAAFVVAGAGGRVAKHGNRAASSQCGSADLLEELGVKIDLGPEGVARCIEEAGIGFCFAPTFHPSMKHAAPVRKELGVPTIFNFLGPLTNPAGAQHQAIGVSDPDMAPKMVEVLRRLGSTHVIAFHGADGLDEITTTGPTTVWELRHGEVTESSVDPTALGVPTVSPEELKGGTPEANAAAAHQVLEGKEGAATDVVALNAGAALVAADLAGDLKEGLEKARGSIDSGAAAEAFNKLVEISNS